MYDLNSKFDLEQHMKHYVNYLEVVIHEDGTVEYAVPSHQEKLIAIAMNKLNVSRQELFNMCPEEYYFDVLTWLCKITGCVSVWSGGYKAYNVTSSQFEVLYSFIENKVMANRAI